LQVPPIFPRVCLTSPREAYQDVQWGIKICTYGFPLQSVPVFITYRKCFAKLFGLSGTQFSQNTVIWHCPPPRAFWILLYALLKYDAVSMKSFLSNLHRFNGIRWTHMGT
jgi:hypothetical protein